MASRLSSSEIAQALSQSAYPLFAIDLDDLSILFVNEAGYELFGWPSGSLDRHSIVEIVRASDRPAVETSVRMLGSRVINGYLAVRNYVKADGTELTANSFVRRVLVNDTWLALATIERDVSGLLWPFVAENVDIALAITDHHWVIEHVSSDVQRVLGLSPGTYKGAPLLGLVEPVDVQNVMLAIGRLAAGGGSVTLPTRLRASGGVWRDVFCLIVTMCDHSPPRLGLAFASVPESGESTPVEDRPRVATVFSDARCSDVLSGVDAIRSRLPALALSARQWEILTRLIDGDRVRDIADAMYLSPSTVRNHLTALYRKFGVHSQGELLAYLLRASG
jgi:DNA-binding CsgD family transcriptional regulator